MKAKFGITAILTGIFVGAISYWPIAYEKLNIIDSYSWLIVGASSFISAFICRFLIQQMPMRIALYITFGVVLSVILRIIYDTIFLSSSSHNLAPLEIIVAAIQSLPLAFLGAYLAKGLKKRNNHNT